MDLAVTLPNLVRQYEKYSQRYDKPVNFPKDLESNVFFIFVLRKLNFAEFQYKKKLHVVRIYMDTPTFDRITKDVRAKFEDMLSTIGGTLGLLTGFSIISGVEILYFIIRTLAGMIFPNKNRKTFIEKI